MDYFTYSEYSALRTIKKIKIMVAVLELPGISTANSAHLPRNWAKWADWQCCLAGSCQTAHRILIFSTAIDAKPSFYMKFIAT